MTIWLVTAGKGGKKKTKKNLSQLFLRHLHVYQLLFSPKIQQSKIIRYQNTQSRPRPPGPIFFLFCVISPCFTLHYSNKPPFFRRIQSPLVPMYQGTLSREGFVFQLYFFFCVVNMHTLYIFKTLLTQMENGVLSSTHSFFFLFSIFSFLGGNFSRSGCFI